MYNVNNTFSVREFEQGNVYVFCVLRQWSMWSLPVKSRRIWDVGHSTFDRDFSFFSSK